VPVSEYESQAAETRWPLDTPAHVMNALAEQGISPDDAAQLVPSLLRLSAWQAPLPTSAQRDQLLARLTPHLPVPTPATLSPTTLSPTTLSPTTLRRFRRHLASLAQVFLSQARLLRPAVWVASALAITLATLYALTLPHPMGEQDVLVFALPLIAATGVAFLYGPETDAGLELALATPTSPRIVLMSRFALLFGFDAALALAGTTLLAGVRGEGVWALTLVWLGPMALLSALSLALSIFLGPAPAVGGAAALWLSRVVRFDGGASLQLTPSPFWPSSPLTLALALGVLVVAIYLAPRSERLNVEES
jgi:hypothetical protein